MISNKNEYMLTLVAIVVKWYSLNISLWMISNEKWIHVDIGCNCCQMIFIKIFLYEWFQMKNEYMLTLDCNCCQIIFIKIFLYEWFQMKNEYMLTLVATVVK